MLKMEVRKVHLGDGLAGILLSRDGLAASTRHTIARVSEAGLWAERKLITQEQTGLDAWPGALGKKL